MDFSSVDPVTETRVVLQFPFAVKLRTASESLEPYRKVVEVLLSKAEKMVIKDDDGAKQAVVLGTEAKRLNKELDTEMRRIIDDPDRFVKAVRGIVKQFSEPLAKVETICKKKNAEHQWKKEVDRRAAEKRAEELQKKAQEDVNKLAAEKGVEAPIVPRLVIKQEPETVRTETGASAHIRMVWDVEIVDENSVPREFCSPDMKKLREAVKMGYREIEGVKIYEKPSTVFRG